MKKKHIIISGKVQGVGFRYWLYQKAKERNVFGWVKNNTAGEVEVVLIGDNKDVNHILKQCKIGPSFSNVTNIEIADYQKEYLKKSFDILDTIKKINDNLN